jgi:EAL domain-containing protein (putative c-di-GMP-specific phosphodiesterase class I)
VNLSARHIGRTNLLRSVFCALQESQLNPQSLAIEITESSARLDASRAPTLQWLKAMGVRIVLDDFGTSYSSPSQLKSFPIDMIKIDRSFVDNITSVHGDVAITSAIITMAHSLEVKAGAKGVESADQHHLLRSLGCDEVQGFLFSRPLPADEATRLLAEGAALVGASGPLAPSGTSEPLVPTGSRASALAEEGAHGGS